MPVYEHPTSLVIPVQFGNLKTTFFINQNLYTVNEECNTIPHNHPHYELMFFESGTSNQIINYQNYPVNEGDIIVIHPGEYHF